MALSRECLLIVVLLVASCVVSGMTKTIVQEVAEEPSGAEPSVGKDTNSDAVAAVAPSEHGARALRAAKSNTEQEQKSAQPKLAIPGATSPDGERTFEQQILVVKGNPSQEELNEEIRKALRSLLGAEQGDQVQIRQLKNVEELRRVVPGAGPGPIGLKLVN